MGRVLGQLQAQRPRGCIHPGNRSAQPLLGAGRDRHPEKQEPVLRGTGGQRRAQAAVSAGRRHAAQRQHLCQQVQDGRSGGYDEQVTCGGLVLQEDRERKKRAPLLQIRGRDGPFRDRERPQYAERALRGRRLSVRDRRAVPGEGFHCRIRIYRHRQERTGADRPAQSGDPEKLRDGVHAALVHSQRRKHQRKGICRLAQAVRTHGRQSGAGLGDADHGKSPVGKLHKRHSEQDRGAEVDDRQHGRKQRLGVLRRPAPLPHCRRRPGEAPRTRRARHTGHTHGSSVW